MPIAFSTSNGGAADSASSASASLTISGSDTYGILGSFWAAFSEETASGAFNGQSATRIGTAQRAGLGFFSDLDAFARVAPQSGNAVATLTNSVFEMLASAAVYTGVDQTAPRGTVYQNGGSESSGWSVSVADASSGDICCAIVGAHRRDGGSATIGVGSGTQRQSVSSGGGGIALSIIEFTASSSNPSLSGTAGLGTEGFWFCKGFKLIAASGGSTTYTFAVSGSISYTGTAVYQRTRVLLASGSLALSGAASYLRTRVFSALGSILFSGTAAYQHQRAISSSGSITFSGSASMSFTPAGGGAVNNGLTLTGAGA